MNPKGVKTTQNIFLERVLVDIIKPEGHRGNVSQYYKGVNHSGAKLHHILKRLRRRSYAFFMAIRVVPPFLSSANQCANPFLVCAIIGVMLTSRNFGTILLPPHSSNPIRVSRASRFQSCSMYFAARSDINACIFSAFCTPP